MVQLQDRFEDVIGTRVIRLGDHPWFDHLRAKNYVWQGASPDRRVLVVAVASGEEWAAYYQLPWQEANVTDVADYGTKLPRDVARELFPGVRLEWRP